MEDLFILIEKLLSKEITYGESIKLQELYRKYEIDEEKLASHYLLKWEEAFREGKEDPIKKEKVWKSIQKELKKSKHEFIPRFRKSINWLKAAAAVLILALMTGAGIYVYNTKNASHLSVLSVITENGQKAKVELPDGSFVWLNSESKLTYASDFGKRKRLLNLDGEAYFEVKKEFNKPFIVQAENGLKVKALGTKFSVKSYKNDDFISSTLFEGKIEVSNDLHSAILNPNEEIIVSKNDGTFAESKIESREEKLFWMGKNLVFKEEKLANIVKILGRMYDVEFHFESSDLQNIKYTGEIKNIELNNVMSLISTVSPVKFESKNQDILIKKI